MLDLARGDGSVGKGSYYQVWWQPELDPQSPPGRRRKWVALWTLHVCQTACVPEVIYVWTHRGIHMCTQTNNINKYARYCSIHSRRKVGGIFELQDSQVYIKEKPCLKKQNGSSRAAWNTWEPVSKTRTERVFSEMLWNQTSPCASDQAVAKIKFVLSQRKLRPLVWSHLCLCPNLVIFQKSLLTWRCWLLTEEEAWAKAAVGGRPQADLSFYITAFRWPIS